jgi:hypothetical protein
VNFNKRCRAILDSKQQRLQLLIIILPDRKLAGTYGKFSIKSKILKVWF